MSTLKSGARGAERTGGPAWPPCPDFPAPRLAKLSSSCCQAGLDLGVSSVALASLSLSFPLFDVSLSLLGPPPSLVLHPRAGLLRKRPLGNAREPGGRRPLLRPALPAPPPALCSPPRRTVCGRQGLATLRTRPGAPKEVERGARGREGREGRQAAEEQKGGEAGERGKLRPTTREGARKRRNPPTHSEKGKEEKKISCGAPPGYRAASPAAGGGSRRCRRASSLAGTDMVLLAQGACCSNQWLAAVLLSLCSCLPAGQSVDFPWAAVDNMLVRKGDTAVLR